MPYRAQSVNRLTERVHAAIRATAGDPGIERVLVACSGGADSTCLAHAVAVSAHSVGWSVTIGHVRHVVRADDARDADAVRALADSLHVPFRSTILANDVKRCGQFASEGRLRTLRYHALSELAKEARADAVLMGHTMDDQAETVLLHLFRGAGFDGLAGMVPDSRMPILESSTTDAPSATLRVVRPLLAISHAETLAYCLAHGLPVAHDPTNDDRTWTRNWLRHVVMPELRTRNPDITGTLARAAIHLSHDATFLNAETRQALVRCGHQHEAGVSRLRRADFAGEPIALRFRMLRHLARLHTGAAPAVLETQNAVDVLTNARASRVAKFGRLSCVNVRGEIICGREVAVIDWILSNASASFPLHAGRIGVRIGVPYTFPPRPGASHSYMCVVKRIDPATESGVAAGIVQIGYFAIPNDAALIIRTREPGDRFRPVGTSHYRRLADFLADCDVPALVRDRLPLLVVNGTIAWVIGHAFGADFVVSRAEATHLAVLSRQDA